MKKIKIAIYFDGSKSAKWQWNDFLNGDVGLSGTDSQSLLLANDFYLHKDSYDFYFFSNVDLDAYQSIQIIRVLDLLEAISTANKLSISVVIFNNKFDEMTTDALVLCDTLQQACIVWDQNGPYARQRDILTNTKYLKKIVCVSKYQYNQCRHQPFFSKMTYIYNGRDYIYKPFENISNNSVIKLCFIGAINETKGFHWLCKAWPNIIKQIPNAHLRVIGSIKIHDVNRKTGITGIAEASFEENYILPYLGKSLLEISNNNVVFVGQISPNDIFNELCVCDLGIINPNVTGGIETFCVSAIDFQGLSVPVIGGRAAGLKETVAHKKTGYLVKDPENLADDVVALLKNRVRLGEYKKNCSTWVVEKFSRKIVFENWQKLIDDIINDVPNKTIPLSFKNGFGIKVLVKELIRLKNKLLTR